MNKPSVSVSTVFVNNTGVKLPKKEMLVLYRGLSSEMYLTSTGPKKKDKSGKGKSKLDQNKSDKLKSLAVMNEEKGIICSRKKLEPHGKQHFSEQLFQLTNHSLSNIKIVDLSSSRSYSVP